MTASVFHLPF